jgi:tagatose 6-phosphate kinase
MILCIGTTPAAQRVMVFPQFRLDAVNRAKSTADGAAGKSINVAKVLHALGAETLATGFLGGPRGGDLRELLAAQGVRLEFVEVDAPTRQCVTVLDQATGQITELVEESRPVAPEAYDKLLGIIEGRVSGCEALIMSGTIASGGPPDLYARCVCLARDAGALSVVDASGTALLEALKTGPGLVKPNRAELQVTVGRELSDEKAVMEGMRELSKRGAQRVVVTAGADPALAYDGKHFWRISSPPVRVVNPIGSGDAFTAALTWRLTVGEDLGTACAWGSAAGAANAMTTMAGEVRPQDVNALLSRVQVEPVSS